MICKKKWLLATALFLLLMTGCSAKQQDDTKTMDMPSVSDTQPAEDAKRITIEKNGEALYTQAEQAYEKSDFIGAMQAVQQIDDTYSLYDSAQELYLQCRDILIQGVSTPSTVTEYETALTYLNNYQQAVDDEAFETTKQKLTDELELLRKTNAVIDKAGALYDSEKYKDALDTIENGLKTYPKNENLTQALEYFHNCYIVDMNERAKQYMEDKDYKNALRSINDAAAIYPCDEFQELAAYIEEQSKLTTRLKNKIDELLTGVQKGWNKEVYEIQHDGVKSYIVKSGKKIALGDYTEDKVTVLSTAGNIIASLSALDTAFDIRDLTYDIQHIGEDEYIVLHLAADAVALIPVIGALKYFKYTGKNADKVKDAVKLADAVSDTTKNVSHTADAVADMAKITDDISDSVKTIDKVAEAEKNINKLTDAAKSITPKQAENLAYEKFGGELQKSFKNGKPVAYGIKGSTRPDIFTKINGKNTAIEVKRYNLNDEASRNSLYSVLGKQIKERSENLPKGTKQMIVLNTQGMNVPQNILDEVVQKIQYACKDSYPNIPVEIMS